MSEKQGLALVLWVMVALASGMVLRKDLSPLRGRILLVISDRVVDYYFVWDPCIHNLESYTHLSSFNLFTVLIYGA